MLTIILALLPALVLFAYILWADRRQPEPASELIKALWNGVLAVFLSGFISIPLHKLGIYSEHDPSYLGTLRMSLFGAGIPEELAKFYVLWRVVKKNIFFDERMDGLVYAACVGLGFAGVENITYLATHQDILMEIAITRAFLAVPLHFCCALFMGFWFSEWWWGKNDFRAPRREASSLLIALCVPILLHTAYDWACFSSNIFLNGEEPSQKYLFYILLFLVCCVFHNIARTNIKKTQKTDILEAERLEAELQEAGLLEDELSEDELLERLEEERRLKEERQQEVRQQEVVTKNVEKNRGDSTEQPTHDSSTPVLRVLGYALALALCFVFGYVFTDDGKETIDPEENRQEYFEQLVADEPPTIFAKDAKKGSVEAMCAVAVQCWLTNDKNRDDEGDEWIKKALETKDSAFVINCINDIAYIYHGVQRYGDAIVILEHAIEFFPREANLYDSCGEMYYLFGVHKEAIHKWNQTIDIDPDFLDHVPNHETDLHKYLQEAGYI